MGFQLDRRNRQSYATQVQRQAFAQLVAGRLHPGDRLPSVRHLARDLGISRTTAERIQAVLCDTMLAEIRPRKGAFVASPGDIAHRPDAPRVQALYEFLRHAVLQGREMGLRPVRLAQLIAAFDEAKWDGTEASAAWLPILATRDAYECILPCLGEHFPATLIHLLPNANASQFPRHARYLLTGYYLGSRARRIAESVGCSVLYVRYNVALLDRAMAIPPGELRYFVTRDADNAETTRVFLASAYPEVATERYVVTPVREFLDQAASSLRSLTIWPTITAVPFLKDRIPAKRMRVLHPILADDFIEELRCLALLG